ncbi:MoaD/ThiS family protein [Terrabacter sp. Root181]|uniref:MoaD/ThiS family protein n=1 Tax=Terrabacter sp. Root181 TaxID=1736484 RepID=UPI0009EAEA34
MAPSGPEPRTTEPVAAAVPATPVATTSAATVTVRYWAAARAAAGTDSETRTGATVGEVVDAAVAAHPDLARVARVATFLLDGRKVGRDAPVVDGGTVEVLPPFAGG